MLYYLCCFSSVDSFSVFFRFFRRKGSLFDALKLSRTFPFGKSLNMRTQSRPLMVDTDKFPDMISTEFVDGNSSADEEDADTLTTHPDRNGSSNPSASIRSTTITTNKPNRMTSRNLILVLCVVSLFVNFVFVYTFYCQDLNTVKHRFLSLMVIIQDYV